MKTITGLAILGVFVLSIAAPRNALAISSAPSASGLYTFALEDGFTKRVEFSATADERGVATGELTIRDEGRVPEPDPKGGEDQGDSPGEFVMTARITSLTIEHNRAVMGGTVTDSSHPSYIGKWIQFVVEDNGDGREEPDRVGWCFCTPEPGGWVPTDYEDPLDQGAYLTWWATDAERRDDNGIPSENIMPGTAVGCPAIILAAYEFAEISNTDGNIQVVP